MNLFTSRAGDYLGYDHKAAELIGIPEPEMMWPKFDENGKPRDGMSSDASEADPPIRP